MASTYIQLPVEDGGGGPGTGTVTSVSLSSSDGSITVGGTNPVTTSGIIDVILSPKNADTFAGFDDTGALESVPGFNIDINSGGMNTQLTESPDDNGGGTVHQDSVSFTPLQDSPNDSWNITSTFADIDPDSSGFDFGTNGTSVNVDNVDIQHHGTSDIGSIGLRSNNFSIGNGTDPITVRGIAYSYGFGQVNANVTLTGQIQGYGFQPSVDEDALFLSNVLGFYDFANINTELNGYTSFAGSPNIAAITNNNNYNGFNTSPHILELQGNAGFTGFGVFPNIDLINSGNFNGLSISPNITENRGNAVGISVNMGNITNYAGVKSSLVVQDITYQYKSAGPFGDTVSVQYTDTVLAGNEVASLVGTAVTVQIESGVSTATQVMTALSNNIGIAGNLNFSITGTASNPQVTYATTNLSGGVNPGTKKAADFNGDVSINGALSFTGALSVGAISAYAPVALSNGGGAPSSADMLITAPSAPANATIANADFLGINTAMLLSIGDNAAITTSLIGIAALGLPAVVSMGTGSTVDHVEGALFAISLDNSATGGAIDTVDLCRSLALPNGGVTSVSKLRGYKFDLPVSDPATTTWGFYMEPNCHNFLGGRLKIGGSDTENAAAALEIQSTTRGFLNARMTTTQRDAITAVNGLQIYNTTTDKLQVYAAGVWVDLH